MALIYSKANQTSINRAVEKARKVKPLVRVIGFGHFQVKGSKGTFYEVKFSKQDGEFVVDCGCQANKERSLPCYHSASVGPLFKQQVAQRAAEKAAPETCERCGKREAYAVGWCEECVLEQERDLYGGLGL